VGSMHGRGDDAEFAGGSSDGDRCVVGGRAVRPVAATGTADCLMQRPKERERIAVAIARRIGAARHIGSESGNASRDARVIEHIEVVALESGLREEPIEERHAPVELVPAHAEMESARLPERNVDAGLLREIRSEPWPLARRSLCPARIARHAHALALDPDEAKIAPRRTACAIVLVQHRKPAAQPSQAESERHPDQAASDDRQLVVARVHGGSDVVARAKRRIAGICASKSWNA